MRLSLIAAAIVAILEAHRHHHKGRLKDKSHEDGQEEGML